MIKGSLNAIAKGDCRLEFERHQGGGVMQGVVHLQDRIDEWPRMVNGNQNKKLQSTSQPQYKMGNVIYHVHIKCPQSISP